jgi:(1->4)-alpha-D-glucan 1-alpha-D-glucosylmutase
MGPTTAERAGLEVVDELHAELRMGLRGDRAAGRREKALREAKTHTAWTNNRAGYEEAARSFAEAVLGSAEFMESFRPFVRRVAAAGRISSLSQVALKLASPGVCDVYQGCELWDLSLVDPDNRRSVDFDVRRRALDAIRRRTAEGPSARAAFAREVSSPGALRDGRAKLLLLREGLRLRRDDPELLLAGDYQPLVAEGPHADRVVAFARRAGDRALVCVVPRLVLRLLDTGNGTIRWEGRLSFPPGLARELRDVVTGARFQAAAGVELAELLFGFPVALLASVPERSAAPVGG